MKAMKGMSVNRVLGSLKRKRKTLRVIAERPLLINPIAKESMSHGSVDMGLDTPEANAARNVVCGHPHLRKEVLIGPSGCSVNPQDQTAR